MKGLELLARGNVVDKLEYFLRDHKSSLVLYWNKEEGYEHHLIFMLYAKTGYHEVSLAIHTQVTPIIGNSPCPNEECEGLWRCW